MEEENNKPESFDIIEPSPMKINDSQDKTNETETETETEKEKGIKNCFKFPTAYSVLLIVQLIVFILTFIIPKGRYATIFYEDGQFTYTPPDPDAPQESLIANQTTLDNLGLSINFENFDNGNIKKAIAIPGTYEKISGHNLDFFDMFLNPVLGMIDSADIAFSLMILGGNIAILVEMKALTNGLKALAKALKGRGFVLLCVIEILVSIGGTTFGMAEECLAFYPILMPIFLKNGLDGMLSAMPMYSGSSMGTMFSTVNAFAVVIASYSAGINFSDGLWFRLIGLILADALTCGYLYRYYRKIQLDEKNSLCYHLKKKLEDKFLKEEKEAEGGEIKNDEESRLKTTKKEEDNEFTLIQKIALLLFLCSFIILIIGVVALDWWFNQMTAVFLVNGIILMILLRQDEAKAVSIFTKGVGEFASASLIIGLARGVNVTLENGMISDTLLHALADTLGNMNKVLFAIVMVLIFIVLGFFIQSSSALAVLSMPIFAPLAENVGCSRALIINSYMFGQNFSDFISPTGLLLITLQLTEIPFNLWIKFIWPYLIILLVFLLTLIMINTAI